MPKSASATSLCGLFVRLDCVGLVDGSRCPLSLSQAGFGEVTGLTAVSVNRVLQDLRHSGLIELKRKVLTIRDLPALERIAMFDANYLRLKGEGKHLAANL